MGFYLDKLVVYLFKLLRRAWRTRGSRNWQPVQAVVTYRSAFSGDLSYPTATVQYTYRFDGKPYESRHKQPFLRYRSAIAYTALFPVGRTIEVCVNPHQPDLTIIPAGNVKISAAA